MMRLSKDRILLLLGIFILSACASADMPQGIPDFSMIMPTTDEVFHSKDIPAGKPSIIIWFDPNCRDCQEETEHILAEMERFKHVNIYLITKHPYDELMIFYNHLRLDTCTNMKVGIDTTASIARAYKMRGTPLTLVYDEDKILTGVFNGKAETKKILEVINKKI